MPTTYRRDPLLAIARLVVGAAVGLVGFAAVMISIGLAAALTVQRTEVLTKLATTGIADNGYVAIMLALALVIALLTLMFLFLRELFRIVGSVERGDPFLPINADRLARMAWLNLGSQMILFALAGIGIWLDHMKAALLAEDAINLGVTETLLTLVLFILARVFRVGAAMREELDGTV